MTVPRRTQQRRVEESARRLVDAAIELIVEKGYAATTAAEIGIRAGYSRAMVAVRYGTKEDLVAAMLSARFEDRLNPPPDPGLTGLERVLSHLRLLQEFGSAEPQELQAILTVQFEAVRPDPFLRARVRSWLEQVEGSLEEGLRSGQHDGSVVGDLDPAATARELTATVIGYVYGWLLDPEHLDLTATLTAWATRLEARLGAPPPVSTTGPAGEPPDPAG